MSEVFMGDRLVEAERLLKRPRKVLLVDDDDLLRESLALGFQDDPEIELDLMPDGEGALSKITDGEKYDCIILDLNLGAGHMDGVQVFKHIRTMDRETPVAFLTGYMDDERFAHAKMIGWHSVQAKPVNLDELKNMVCSLVKRETVNA